MIKRKYIHTGEKEDKTWNVYGPYVRVNKHDLWHWKKKCSSYPEIEDPEIKYTSNRLSYSILCKECFEIELSEGKPK